MKLTIPTPRLLPLTIAALASLLAMKSIDMVRAAVPADLHLTLMAAAAEHPDPAAHPAAAPAAQAAAPAPAQPPASAQPPAAAPAAPPAPPVISESEKAILLELRQRRDELDTREAAVKARESVLTAAEQKLSGRVEELQTLQKRLEGLDAARKQREDASWQGLVKLYESMKPRDAANIFNDLAMPTLLQIVDRMKETKAAAVMAAMNPDKARDVTAQLAKLRSQPDAAVNLPPPGPTPPPRG
jgi:flagellar motility protein MotE (MotC chaperone)